MNPDRILLQELALRCEGASDEIAFVTAENILVDACRRSPGDALFKITIKWIGFRNVVETASNVPEPLQAPCGGVQRGKEKVVFRLAVKYSVSLSA